MENESQNLYFLNEFRSPVTIITELRHSLQEHRLFAQACTLAEWLVVCARDFGLAMWLLTFTQFRLGETAEELDIAFAILEAEQNRLVQKLINGLQNTLTRIKIHSSMYEGRVPLDLSKVRNLRALTIEFDRMLDIRTLENPKLQELNLIARSDDQCRINGAQFMWIKCPNLSTVTIDATQINNELWENCTGIAARALIIRNLKVANHNLPTELFEDKRLVNLKDSVATLSDHFLRHCAEGNIEAELNLDLNVDRRVQHLRNIQSLRRVTFHTQVDQGRQLDRLAALTEDLGHQHNKHYVLNVRLPANGQLKRYATTCLEAYQRRYANIDIIIN